LYEDIPEKGTGQIRGTFFIGSASGE
jgi:hypothetical protein